MICLMISWMMEVTTTMRISTFFYTIKQGIVNIWKNKLFSLVSIATMTACIFLFGLFYMIVDELPVHGEGCGVRRGSDSAV